MQRLKVGDLVQVIAGRDKGKTGPITKVFLEADRVLVEGIHMVTRHKKPDARDPEGGRIRKETPIHASNVMPIDANTGKPTRIKVAFGQSDKDGGKRTKTRVAVSGAALKGQEG